MKRYSANLSRNQGRECWSIIFRHPIRKDIRGKYGLRIRRGLGTTDKIEAENLVGQMNEILSDETLWNISAKEKALVLYDFRIVSAFYDDLNPLAVDLRQVRNSVIPLPGPEDGYARALIVGTTGAGKTTLLRQLMGTYSKRDRFPSTSAGRTTTCDIEVICSDETNYSAVVTFMPRSEARFYIEECVQSAIQSRLFAENQKQLIENFLVHKDQRFRLSYILGHPSIIDFDSEKETNDDEWDDEDDFDTGIDDGLDMKERKSLVLKLQDYLKRIQDISDVAIIEVSNDLGMQNKELTNEEKEIVSELVLETYLDQSGEFHELVDDILDDVQNRFMQLQNGEVVSDTQGWVNGWTFTTDNRDDFLLTVRKFSSNHVQQWGGLLTPLVEGMRVKGSFIPDCHNEIPKIVLIDGEGLGHTADSASSLPTRITRQFDSVQTILLIDNGTSPMLAASQAALKSIIASGHVRKLALCFTHMDAVKGDNMRKGSEKVNHVKASIGVTLTQLQETYNYATVAHLERNFSERSYFFWNLQDKIGFESSSINQLKQLVNLITSSLQPTNIPKASAKYESLNLFVSLQNAIKRFHERWDAKLGLKHIQGIPFEHWSRIKAMSKRLAFTSQDNYDNLAPIADFISLLSEHLGLFLGKPYSWDPTDFSDESKLEVIDAIKQDVFSQLHTLSYLILWKNPIQSWIQAFEYRGVGSTKDRAKEIQRIFQKGSPILGETPAEAADEMIFLKNISILIEASITKYDGKLSTFGQFNDEREVV